MLKESRELQKGKYKDGVDIGELCVATSKERYWSSSPFDFPSMNQHKETWLMSIKRKINGNAKKVKGNGISTKDFHAILDKASQPIKKIGRERIKKVK
jgi:hypothetical protein